MKPTIILMSLLVACLAATSFGQAHSKLGALARHDSRPSLQAILRTPVEHVTWDDSPFGEVLDWLRSRSKKANQINIIPRWRALADAGVDKETVVTLELEQVTVAQVLDEVLAQLSGADPLVYVSKGNTLRITTRSALRRKLYTRTYDVAEILMQSRGLRAQPQFFSGRQLDYGTATASPAAGIGGSSQTLNMGAFLFGDPNDNNDEDEEVSDDELAERVIEAILKTVAPASWRINGGRGNLSFVDGVLIVRNSADVHQMIGGSFGLNHGVPTR